MCMHEQTYAYMYFVDFLELVLQIKVSTAQLSPVESMATAENLDREKHHFNPAEKHSDPFNNRKTIQ